MDMLVDSYCQEVTDGPKKVISMNLVKVKEGDKERNLSAYYEQLLEQTKADFTAKGSEIVYRNFGWHKETKHGTEPFSELLQSLDEDFIKFGIYHEVRNQFTKEGQVRQWQKGVIRTNCIDCLDRTNVAKMIIC